MEQADIKRITNAIEAEMEHQSFQNMGVEVDESAYEPNVVVFTTWYDEFSEKQAELIDTEFHVFETSEYLNGAEVYTEEDVNTFIDADGIKNSEGSVRFVALIDADIEVTDEFADKVAVEYVRQMTNFWDAVYSEELLKDRFEENLNEDLPKEEIKLKKLNEDIPYIDDIVDEMVSKYKEANSEDIEDIDDWLLYELRNVFSNRNTVIDLYKEIASDDDELYGEISDAVFDELCGEIKDRVLR